MDGKELSVGYWYRGLEDRVGKNGEESRNGCFCSLFVLQIP